MFSMTIWRPTCTGLLTHLWIPELLFRGVRVTRDLLNMGGCTFSPLGLICMRPATVPVGAGRGNRLICRDSNSLGGQWNRHTL